MKKIPTLFVRDPDTGLRYVTREVHSDCGWVLAGEGVATRKYDGTCVMFDGSGWWARREVKRGQNPPPYFQPVDHDDATGKTVGWVPMAGSQWERWFTEAHKNAETSSWPVGTYELLGPKVNGNPERLVRHELQAHAAAEVLDAPRTFDALEVWMRDLPYEGVVWHHQDGRMAKLKRKDFPK